MEFERGIWGAAREGETDRLVSLLEKGVEPSSRDSSGYTALHYAARAGHGDTVRVGSSQSCLASILTIEAAGQTRG